MNGYAKIGIPIGIGVIIIAIAVVALSNQNSVSMEVEDVLDKELRPDEESPEVQAKLDEILKNVEENKEKVESSDYDPSRPREWITSGPFQIDRSEYVLGEKIFLIIGGLNYDEKGQVVFLRPVNETHHSVYKTIPFDGAKKNAFNFYIQPQLSGRDGVCSAEDIIGNWIVMFRGTNYPNINFEITDKIVPGDEDSYSKTKC